MVERDAVRRAYDELAPDFDAARNDDAASSTLLSAFLDGLPADACVLDAGCGAGQPVLRRAAAATTVADVVGLDFSRGQLSLAADAVPDAPLVQGDMTRLPLATDSVDAAVAYWSLIHVPDADQPAVLAEFARVCRPGGRLLVTEGHGAWRGENPDWLDTGVEMAWDIAGRDATRERLREAGFTVVREVGAGDGLEEASGAADDDPETDAGESETAAADADDPETDDADDPPWVFFEARLDDSG
jgi:ubiquinone/menaquinone biosynthesis C-methylase UbiE